MATKKLIISIDAGGIRGVMPLVHLREIQLLLSKNLHEYNPHWWGTSTGALISAGLSVQSDPRFIHRIQAVLDMYEFRANTVANPPSVSNPARAFEKLVEFNLGGHQLSEFKNLNIVACRLDNMTEYVFNYRSNCAVADAVRASCAVPEIFPAKRIDGVNYVDGYLVAKNPALLALENIVPDENTILLSLGCGVLRQFDYIEFQASDAHLTLTQIAEKTGMKYFRLNPVLQYAMDDMQNTTSRNIFNLKRDAMDNIHRCWDEIVEFVKVLDLQEY
jgi:patatin-like phospholipase/acyl hydrolase